jgi:hypothetical protein
MKILLASPWRNCWVNHMQKYFESKGHTFDFVNEVRVKDVSKYDVLMSGWSDDITKKLSKIPKLCPKYFCWVRSYEFWHNNLSHFDYRHFDNVFFCNKYIMDNMKLPQGKFLLNSTDLEAIRFKERKHGKEVILLADINFKKGLPLLVQVARKMPDYNFNIYGRVQDRRTYIYLRYCNLPNVFIRGFTENLNETFDKMNYIILTSPVEGNPNCIVEGMSAGLKPIVHRFVGSEGQFPFYWDTIDEAVALIKEDKYESREYRKWIEDNYDMWKVLPQLEEYLLTDKLVEVA